MNVSKQIIRKLRLDKKFRMLVGIALEVTEQQVRYLANKNSDNLTKQAAVEVYEAHGFEREEMFVRTISRSVEKGQAI